KAADRAQLGQRYFADWLAGQIEDADNRPRLVQVRDDKAGAECRGRLDGVLRWGDQLLPLAARWLANVDLHDPAQRRIEVGNKPEERAVVVDKFVFGIKARQQLDDRRFRRFGVVEKTLVLLF